MGSRESSRGTMPVTVTRGWAGRPCAVLFDRDGTLIDDVPFNGDPARVTPRPGAALGLAMLRAAGLRTAVASNQSGIAKGFITNDEATAVFGRLDRELGPFDAMAWCPHDEGDGCRCRKPAPGLIIDIATSLGVEPEQCVVVGDIARDIEAAHRAGAVGVLVPTDATRISEVA